MTARPQPPRRYLDADLQAAYAVGFEQEYEHDSFALLNRFSGLQGELLAAALFGAADVLIELAERQPDGAADRRLWEVSEP
jgi:hypothetical protein